MAGVKRGPKAKFKKGDKVYYLKTHVLSPEAELEEGVIHAYNPAVKGSYLVTEGKPFYTIQGVKRGPDVYDVQHVAAHTPFGRRYLLDVKAYLYLQRVTDILRSAAVGVAAVAKRMRDPRVPGGLPYGAIYTHVMLTPEEYDAKEKACSKAVQKEALAAVKGFTAAKKAAHHSKQAEAPVPARGGGRRGRENVDRPPGSESATRVRKAHGRRGQG